MTYGSFGWLAARQSHHCSPRSDRRPTPSAYSGRCYSGTVRARTLSDRSLSRRSRRRSRPHRRRPWTPECSWGCRTGIHRDDSDAPLYATVTHLGCSRSVHTSTQSIILSLNRPTGDFLKNGSNLYYWPYPTHEAGSWPNWPPRQAILRSRCSVQVQCSPIWSNAIRCGSMQ